MLSLCVEFPLRIKNGIVVTWVLRDPLCEYNNETSDP